MKTIYGVKSNTPITEKLKNGHTMYDWVVRKKCYPAFCMRTLAGENKITAEEIEFLKAKGCKIGLVIRDLTEAEVSGINGTEVAIKAVETAKELGVPQNSGIALFAEIKPEWSVNHNWMFSFAGSLNAQGFVAGFIGNPDSSKILTLTVRQVILRILQRVTIILIQSLWQPSLSRPQYPKSGSHTVPLQWKEKICHFGYAVRHHSVK